MKDLFDFDVDDEKYFEELKSPKATTTIKKEFRRMHGYNSNYFCKDCKYFLEGLYRSRKYFKCEKIGLSHSEATDIRKSDVACNLYVVDVKGE